MAWKAKTTIDGKETEVELQELPEGVIAKEQFDVQFATELKRRSDSIRNTTRTELLADDAFKAEAMKAWKVEAASGDKKKALDEEQLNGLRTAWEKEHVAPLKAQVDEFSGTIKAMRANALASDLLAAAARAGVKKSLLEPPVEGAEPMIVAMMRPLFGFDDKTATWALKKGDAFDFSAKATEKRPYKSVDEFIGEWAKRKESAEFLDRPRQDGAGFGGAAEGQVGGTVQITRADARIRSKFIAAEEQAKKQGATLEITD